jgi:hypothetical protein
VGRLKDTTRSHVALDPRGRVIYFLRTGGNAGSLHALSLDSGQVRQIYLGEPHAPAFAGMRVLSDGRLLFSFQAQNHDILSNEFVK